MRTLTANKQIFDHVRAALARYVEPREMNGQAVVDLPLMYPSGAMVTVQVDMNGDQVLVTDIGHGLVEAEFAAAEQHYGTVAPRAAEDFSVSFDGYAMFTLWVPVNRLEAAIVCVANASCRAASEAVRRAAEVQALYRNEQLYDRISEVFGRNRVAKSTEIQGRHANWDAHNVITLPGRRRAIFEFMTPHTNSISSKFLMFSDIRALDNQISLNTVVKELNTLGEKASLIGDLANIVPLTATDQELRRFAAAA